MLPRSPDGTRSTLPGNERQGHRHAQTYYNRSMGLLQPSPRLASTKGDRYGAVVCGSTRRRRHDGRLIPRWATFWGLPQIPGSSLCRGRPGEGELVTARAVGVSTEATDKVELLQVRGLVLEQKALGHMEAEYFTYADTG
jgi:hypothetical protein